VALYREILSPEKVGIVSNDNGIYIKLASEMAFKVFRSKLLKVNATSLEF
jgi:hypothetical protein